jgi:hypothetical protein
MTCKKNTAEENTFFGGVYYSGLGYLTDEFP